MAMNFGPNLASLQQELDDARAAGQRGYSRTGQTRIHDALNRLNMAQAQGGGQGGPGTAGLGGGDPLTAERDRERNELMRLTEGRGKDILNDPHTAAALKFLGGATSGENTPFNATVRNNMMTSAAGQAASAEGAQSQMLQQQMAMNGGAMSDPSAQAAMRELASRRQGQVMGAANSIDSQANVANFNAQMQGANQLAGVRGAQNAQANQMNLAAAGHRSQFFTEVPTGGLPASGGLNPLYAPQPAQTQNNAPAAQQTAPAGNRPPPVKKQPVINSSGGVGNNLYGPRSPSRVGGAIQVGRGPAGAAGQSYHNGVNTTTGVQRGGGYVQMAGQPNTRINITPQQQVQAILARQRFSNRALGPGEL